MTHHDPASQCIASERFFDPLQTTEQQNQDRKQMMMLHHGIISAVQHFGIKKLIIEQIRIG